MTTQFPTDLLLSFKCLKLTLAIVTPFSKGIITSPTDSPCARYHVTSAFIVCQEVGKEGPLRSVPPSFSCDSLMGVVRICNQPGFSGKMEGKVNKGTSGP